MNIQATDRMIVEMAHTLGSTGMPSICTHVSRGEVAGVQPDSSLTLVSSVNAIGPEHSFIHSNEVMTT